MPSKRLPLYAVIMAGGQGTRFWPSSRRRVPKQLLRITGRRSLLQNTALRLRGLVSWRHMLVVTNVEHAAAVAEHLPRLPRENILIEPSGRNTLPCLALANEWILQRHADAGVIVAPADHLIHDAAGFCAVLRRAVGIATAQPALVTLGVQPTRPETGYGYIEIGSSIDSAGDRRPAGGAKAAKPSWVLRFREKPSLPQAKRFLARGNFLWNAGIFVWRAQSFAAALRLFIPEVAARLDGVWRSAGSSQRRASRGQWRADAAVKRAYAKLPSVSVDVAILEPASTRKGSPLRVAVVPARFDWNDVGSWLALADVWERDADENVQQGRVIAVDTRRSIIVSPQRLVALVGMQDVIVVDTPDALLICARDRAQDVRRVTQELDRRGLRRYL